MLGLWGHSFVDLGSLGDACVPVLSKGFRHILFCEIDGSEVSCKPESILDAVLAVPCKKIIPLSRHCGSNIIDYELTIKSGGA
jgi:hypothetical protein